jgi:small subunit ribosomal protein S11
MTNSQEKKETPTATAIAVAKKKKKKFIPHGRAYIQATYNNTIVTITDPAGDVVAWSSAGRCGFKGPKKATPYAASIIVKEVAEKAKNMGLRSVDVFVKGVGSGREGAVRALNANNINVQSIKDITPIPHNGCRPPKVRRV